MRAALRAAASAFAYFSIVPVARFTTPEPPDARTLAALPIVGATIGALAGCVGLAVARIAPHSLAIACAFAAQLALSGAIHLDGFLDSCDALFATVTPERRFEILKDPRHGTFAIAGIAAIVPLWLAALDMLPLTALPLALAFTGALSRWAAVLQAARYRDVRTTPSAALAARPPATALIGGGVAIVALSFAVNPFAWIAIIVALIVATFGAAWASNKLGGGLVGDSYGFLIILIEPIAIAVTGIGIHLFH